MGGGGRGGPRLAFGHRSREKRNRGSSLSYISPPSYPREHYPTIDHTRTLQRKSVVESHAHTFRSSSSGIPFRTDVARQRSLRPKMSGEIVGGGNRGFYERYCSESSRERLTVTTTFESAIRYHMITDLLH